jgi:hypothetical protein
MEPPVTPNELREAIANAIADYVKAYDVARLCARRAEAGMPRRARGEASVGKIVDKNGRVVWKASITLPPMGDGI